MSGDSHSVNFLVESPAFEGSTVQVDDFVLYESLSEPYGLEISLIVDEPHYDGADALGMDLVLTLDRAGSTQRRLAGIIREVREGGQAQGAADVEGGTWLTVVVVPALWMLTKRRDTRIYQDKTAVQIIDDVLGRAFGDYGRTHTKQLTGTYPTREYCVQYQETDFDFVSRLMEEEGIFYGFDHDGDTEAMVLMDGNAACPRIEAPSGGVVQYQPTGAVIRIEEPAHLVHRRHRSTTTSVVMGDWDWTRATMPFSYEKRATDHAGFDRESYEHGMGRSLTIYDYSPNAYGAEDGELQKRVRHEAHVRDAETIEGVSRVVALAPGTTFELSGHPTLGMDGEYLVVRAVHLSIAAEPSLGEDQGANAEPYHNRFECIPLETAYRPQRRAVKPRVPSIQTAVVTGPGGEEIHVDEHGRIKVQFHWDRLGANDESSSCWIRVEQAWAGAGWGFWWVPRIGMEVVVQFVDGDPDRPLVTGCVYDGANPTPYALPDEKTKSTIKSNSSIGGGGFNEFRYEDLKGEEEIYTHAQKDYNEVVENDHNTLVHHDQTNEVDNDQTQEIHRHQVETVHGNQVMTVDGNRTVHVLSDFDETVDGTETRLVTGDVTETFDANETRTIASNVTETIGVDETRSVTGNHEESVTGNHTQTVGGSATESVTGSLSQSVMGGITTTTPAAYSITAVGGLNVTAAAGIQWVAPGGVTVAAPGGMFQTDSFYDWQGAKQFEIAVTSMGIWCFVNDVTGVAIGAWGFSCTTFAQKVVNKPMTMGAFGNKLKQNATTIAMKAVDLQLNGWFNWCT